MSLTTEINRSEILRRVTAIMRKDLKLGNDIVIEESTPFVGGEADIDSLDILLVLASVERDFGIKIAGQDVGRRIFQNVGTLTDYLAGHAGNSAKNSPAAAVPATPEEFLQRLPHAPPFRFVSKLVEIKSGHSAQGIWSVHGDEDFLKGHFPGRPIVPGVLIAEALAQLSGLAAVTTAAEGRLVQVDVRFEASVVPPAEIQLQSTVLNSIAGLIQCQVQASCRQAIVARGTVTLSFTAPQSASGAS